MPASNKQISQYETAVFGGVYFSEEGNIYIYIYGFYNKIVFWCVLDTKAEFHDDSFHPLNTVLFRKLMKRDVFDLVPGQGWFFFATCFQHIPIGKPWCWNMHTNICPNKITKSCRFLYTSTMGCMLVCGWHVEITMNNIQERRTL